MDHTVTGFDVGGHDIGAVDHHATVRYFDIDIRALNCRGRIKLDDIGGHDLAGHHVIGQNAGQRFLVGKQCFQVGLGDGGKGFVGGCEYGKRTVALERFDQSGGLDGCYQRVEATGLDCGIDDIFLAAVVVGHCVGTHDSERGYGD